MSAGAPRVSVLLPAFDAEATLEVALRSVARQTLTDFECVVVDDGSRDGTLAVARRVAARDARFRVLASTHGGVVAALNRGLAECHAPFVARMDADDVMRKTRLMRQVAALESTPDDAAVGSHVRIWPRGSDGLRAYERWLGSIASAEDVAREAFIECPVVHPTLMARRDVLSDFGYRDAGWPEDYDLVLRLLAAGLSVSVVPERLLLWRDHPGRLTRTSAVCAHDRIVECKAHYLAAGPLRHVERYVLWGYGDTGRELCRALARHDKLPSAIVELHPGRIGQRIAGAPVIHPDALPSLSRAPIVVSVSRAGPRSEVRASLARMGFREGPDYVCAA
jgi:Glycosyl transferase family 2